MTSNLYIIIIAIFFTAITNSGCGYRNIEAYPESACIYLEAEDAQIVTPMQIGDDVNASGGNYVFTNEENAGLFSFTFFAPYSGQYVIDARIRTQPVLPYCTNSGACNSFFVTIDDGATTGNEPTVYHAGQLSEFSWQAVNVTNISTEETCSDTCSDREPTIWSLLKGEHSLTFSGREAYTYLDSILIRYCVPGSCNSIGHEQCLTQIGKSRLP
ncbi:MAG: hypothetical protein JW841_06525 [Deltaproteobacteria bacterium]|nr:hypothetical protein [Deltaproteobacteria bacterium]